MRVLVLLYEVFLCEDAWMGVLLLLFFVFLAGNAMECFENESEPTSYAKPDCVRVSERSRRGDSLQRPPPSRDDISRRSPISQ